ncbi:MAG: DUF1566 domain-containing protein, partial [Lentisphaerae bacterium]|nr:DUF1566 domain-containing protein [Lentisphaerota bacterium]
LSLIVFAGILLAAAQCDCAPAPVPKTGQTTSYDLRDDGYLQLGQAWPSPRFTDNLNGTVTDNLTGLIWLKNANCTVFFSDDVAGENRRYWLNALTAANSLSNGFCDLTDGSTAGDWRLPNVREFESLLDYGLNSPALPSGHPFDNVQSVYYWSSSTFAQDTSCGWIVHLYSAIVNYGGKNVSKWFVLPVKGGQ